MNDISTPSDRARVLLLAIELMCNRSDELKAKCDGDVSKLSEEDKTELDGIMSEISEVSAELRAVKDIITGASFSA